MAYNSLITMLVATVTLMSGRPAIALPAEGSSSVTRDYPHLSVETSGAPGSPDIIMIPGLTSGRWVWDAEARRLASQHRLHIVQVNGFAGRPAGVNASTDPLLPALVQDLHTYISSHHLRPAIVGHSLGGLLALMLVRDHPDDASKLVIVDANPFLGLMFGPQATVEGVRPMAATMRDSTLHASSTQRAAMETRTAETLALDPAAREKIAADGLASDPQVAARALYEDLQTDLRPQLAGIATDTLVLYAFDPTLTFPDGSKPKRETADEIVTSSYAILQHKTLVRIDNSRHFIMADQPERLHDELQAFLSRRVQP